MRRTIKAKELRFGRKLRVARAPSTKRIMGLLDIFSKPKPKPNSKHHYAFAHYTLRQIAFANPGSIFSFLASDARIGFFNDVLGDLDARIEDTECRNFSGEDICFVGTAICDRPCAILQMPPTTNPTEAYFIAIVGRLPLEQLSSNLDSNTTDTLIDYYTLERPVTIRPWCRSVFCAWAGDGTHLNFGNGPRPTIERFGPFLARHIHSGAGLQVQAAYHPPR